MSEYREIQGATVQSLASSTGTTESQIWYDNVNGAFKLQAFQTASWSTGGNLNTSRSQLAGGGTKSAGIVFSGSATNTTAPSVTNGAKTEEYNGTTWSSVNDRNNARRQLSGLGTQTAAVAYTGYADPIGYTNTTENYDGTTWTASGNMTNSVTNGISGGTGTQTAGLNQGGNDGPTRFNDTSEYDGSTWTNVATLPYPSNNITTFGTQTAAVGSGGFNGSTSTTVTNTNEYNGSTWTASNNMLAPLQNNGRNGTQSDGIIFGSFITSSHSTATYTYDGTSWSSSPATMSQGRNYCAGSNTGSVGDAFGAGGDFNETTTYTATEEFTPAGVGTKTITTT